MTIELPYQFLADTVLVVHFAIVAFVVGGLVCILAGHLFAWRWVDAPLFRVLHLVAIAVVVVQAWLGVDCPLTTLEIWLRTEAGETAYRESFVAHWLGRILFYRAPDWVFIAVYSLFGALVVFTWWRFPPRRSPPRR